MVEGETQTCVNPPCHKDPHPLILQHWGPPSLYKCASMEDGDAHACEALKRHERPRKHSPSHA
eukprot:1128216-Pelagomonas_calceolata.AAC.4